MVINQGLEKRTAPSLLIYKKINTKGGVPMIGGMVMANRVKITMTDLPDELGRKVISQIRASEKPSRDELGKKVQDMKLRILANEVHGRK